MTLNVSRSNLEPDSPRIAHFPISFFSMIMGLSGFTLAWKVAPASFFNGMAIWSVFAYATSIAMIIVSIFYAVKIWRYPHAVLEEIRHPVRINFFPSFSISLLLLSMDCWDSLANCSYLVCDEQLDPPHSLHTITCEPKLVYSCGWQYYCSDYR